MYGTAELWNNGRALEPGNELFTQHIGRAAKRAIAALKGRKVGPREYNTQRSAVLRTESRDAAAVTPGGPDGEHVADVRADL